MITTLALVEPSFAQSSPAASPTGVAGTVTTDFGEEDTVGFGSLDVASTVAIQSDGKIIVAGSTQETPSEPGEDFALARYTSTGSLDASFGTGGLVRTDFGGTFEGANAVAVQTDGSILVAGGSGNDTGGLDLEMAFALGRYKMDGSLDPSFGTDGKVITPFGYSEIGASSLALQTDGKILVAGGGEGDFVLARYTSDGSLDRGFGIRGKVNTDFGSGGAEARDVAIQGDGKILVVGTFESGKIGLALARYTTGGSLDRGFGNAGRVTRESGLVRGRAVATLPDGKILVAGSTWQASAGFPGDFAVIRYTEGGVIDRSFGHLGQVKATFGDQSAAMALALQADGKFLTVGTVGFEEEGQLGLARFLPDGSLDRSFGTDGKVTTDFGGLAVGKDVAIQEDGKIVVVGATVEWADFALARYTTTGSLDATFGKVEASASPSPSATGTPRTGSGEVRHTLSWHRLAAYATGIGLLIVLASIFVVSLIHRRREPQ